VDIKMNNTDLKIFTFAYICEHDLVPEQKVALMEWVRDADILDVEYLVLTGEVREGITEEQLNELQMKRAETWKGVADTMSGKTYDLGKFHGAAGALAAAAAVAAAVVAGAKIYKRYLSKAAKACKDKGGTARTACIQKFKMDAQKAKIGAMQKGIAACSKTKDPSKCKASLQTKVAKEKAKLGQG